MCWISWQECLQTGPQPKGAPRHWDGGGICQQLSGTVKVLKKVTGFLGAEGMNGP